MLSYSGWQEYQVSNGAGLNKLDPRIPRPSYALGVLGMPGLTAYVGTLDIGEPKAGETLVVAAATGAVGSVVGQIAKIKGLRAVGIAGGKEKCDYAVKELGFDACIDHRDASMPKLLKEACPKGIDVYFENVGGAVWDAVVPLLNTHARIPLCGLIAQYNATSLPAGPDRSSQLMGMFLVKQIKVQGFIISNYFNRYAAFLDDMTPVDAGRDASSTARTSRADWRTRRRRSWGCSRAATSASCWCRSPTSSAVCAMSRAQKITLLVALYFAQGLPFGFFTIVLPATLRQAGLSLKTIGLVSVLLTLPWLLKFLWAPFVDHRGTRRAWLLTLQLSALVVAAVITQLPLDSSYVLLFVMAFTFNLIAATQDIATDGLAVRMLDARELGLANGIQVGAYRIGMMFGGGLLLKVFDLTDWTVTFVGMAVLIAHHHDSGARDARAAVPPRAKCTRGRRSCCSAGCGAC